MEIEDTNKELLDEYFSACKEHQKADAAYVVARDRLMVAMKKLKDQSIPWPDPSIDQ